MQNSWQMSQRNNEISVTGTEKTNFFDDEKRKPVNNVDVE